MRRFTRKWLEYKIVQAAERFPKRIGIIGFGDTRGGRCLLGLIADEAGEMDRSGIVSDKFMNFISRPSTESLVTKVASANDRGHRWGRIPVIVGLVPGEMKVEKRKVARKSTQKEGVLVS